MRNDATMGRHVAAGTKSDVSVDRFLRELLSTELAALLRFDQVARIGRDPEGIHQLRVGARRIRSELQVVAPALKPSQHARLQRELQWMGGVLGQRRDIAVLIDLLRSVEQGHGTILDDAVFDELAKRERAAATHSAALLDSTRYRRLNHWLVDWVLHPPVRQSAPTSTLSILQPQLTSTLANLARLVDRFGDTPSREQLHRIRIAAKKGRYSAEVASLILGDSVAQIGAELEHVQTILGEIHDRDVAIAFLRGFCADAPLDPTGGSYRDVQLVIGRLEDGINERTTQWRAPLERARALTSSVLKVPAGPSDGTDADHEIE